MSSVHATNTLGRPIRMIAMGTTTEAARSGEEGPGFMVIALDMRSLADRTQAILIEVTKRVRA